MTSIARWPTLIVPGWGGSGPDHWQTAWEHDLDAERVELGYWFEPRREAWVRALDEAIASLARRDGRPPIVVAHSLGCIALAHWARTARRPIRAALLVAPADVEREGCIETLRNFGPVPLDSLPFPSRVVTSDNDPHVSVARAGQLALAWGADLRVIPDAGHLNAASNLGRWALGRTLLQTLLQQTELRRAG